MPVRKFYNIVVGCPICGQKTIVTSGQVYCPSCKIFLGGASKPAAQPKKPILDYSKEETPAHVYQKRAKKSFLISLSVRIFIALVILVIGGYLGLNYTSIGFREKVFYKYNFTSEARNYLRKNTSITVVNIAETKPFGFTHSGYWQPGTNNVKLNTANDEVAVHEFAHAWWEKQRTDKNTIKDLINDTIQLSGMIDEPYYQVAKRAQWIVSTYCFCTNITNVNYETTDDQHFYAYMADFTMGKFKDGPHQLPQFMWKYFDSLFSGNPRVTPCYETNSCDFPQNNDYAKPANELQLQTN